MQQPQPLLAQHDLVVDHASPPSPPKVERQDARLVSEIFAEYRDRDVQEGDSRVNATVADPNSLYIDETGDYYLSVDEISLSVICNDVDQLYRNAFDSILELVVFNRECRQKEAAGIDLSLS
jgi:hypothetical protein